MRILHVAQFLGIGGLEKIIYHLAKYQMNLGHQVAVYIYDWERAWVDYFRQEGIEVITPPLKKDGYDFKLLRRLNSGVKGYDIVHSHDLNPLMYLGPINLWSKLFYRSKRVKLIQTTHGLDQLNNYPRARLYEKIASPMADAVVGVSKNVYNFYLKEVGITPSKVFQIDNGVALYEGELSRELKEVKKGEICKRHNLKTDLPLLVTVARVVPLKDQLFLIESIRKKEDVQLMVVGPSGDDNYFEKLKALESDTVVLTGPRSDVQDYLLASDLFVSASTHEGIPVAILEAMGVGTACLVSDIEGHLVLNQSKQSVEIFKLNQNEDFVQKLENLLKNKELITQFAQIGLEVVRQNYSVSAMGKKYLEVYENLLC